MLFSSLFCLFAGTCVTSDFRAKPGNDPRLCEADALRARQLVHNSKRFIKFIKFN